ncbi:MAG: hypothetical protein DHS20C14_22730 [Phycisphaeraceae bacterium]|nr:MAG: hypothetical protein DHS20C14_22730 [Phycisphaeraceae bacterium]
MCTELLASSGPPEELLDNIVPLTAITLGCTVAFVWVLCATVHAIVKDRATERTKREIAAYVAEGTMTPAEGERLLKARNT